MESKRKNCAHVIYHHKYERNAPEIQNWWYELFRRMESEAAIPPDRRMEVVDEIFPEKLLKRILRVLSFVRTCKPQSCDDLTMKESEAPKKSESLEGSVSEERAQRQEIGPKNPYTRFFRRRPDRAAIWHTLPPLSFEEMNLTQKADALTTSIAVSFVEWMKSISDEDAPTSLTVPLVLKMFEIGFDTHAARSLQVRVREMASVPDGVAILKNLPDMARRNQLRRQLNRDLSASQKKKKVFAFGTKLDKAYQILPPKVADIDKWMVCNRVPQDLESMATVWQGITHLKSTRAYCKYLLEHPEIKPPKYLVEMNMMDQEALKGGPTHGEKAGPELTMASMPPAEKKPEQEFIVL